MFGVMTFGIQMFEVMTFGIQMFVAMTFGIQMFEVMTFGIQMFEVMTFGIQMFGVMTESNVWSGQVRSGAPCLLPVYNVTQYNRCHKLSCLRLNQQFH